MPPLMAEKCNSLSYVVHIVYGCFFYYVLLHIKLVSVYHCINKGYQK